MHLKNKIIQCQPFNCDSSPQRWESSSFAFAIIANILANAQSLNSELRAKNVNKTVINPSSAPSTLPHNLRAVELMNLLLKYTSKTVVAKTKIAAGATQHVHPNEPFTIEAIDSIMHDRYMQSFDKTI